MLKIGFVSAEIEPFVKTGGLADVSGALGKYLPRNRVEMRMVTPLYAQTRTGVHPFFPVDYMQDMRLTFGSRTIHYKVFTAKLPGSETDVYFVDCPELYHRASVYTGHEDEYLRFALLNRAAIEIFQHMHWAPDIIHCNDWQTALIPIYLKTLYNWDKLFAHTRTLLTLHNVGYHGNFPLTVVHEIGLGNFMHLLDDMDRRQGRFNFLKTGIIYADMLSTVSETYAREIQTPDYGFGLDAMLAYRKERLTGIVNGVDYGTWNPQTDPEICKNYGPDTLEMKEENKACLLNQIALPYHFHQPLMGMVTRLVEQKGIDLLLPVMDGFLYGHDVQLVVLGSGEERYERYFYGLQGRHPEKVRFYEGYNNSLAHQIEAGADIFLMPSRYEPCGLNQIYSLKYGTIPIVRQTGGLADTVIPYNWETGRGTGFLFKDYNSDGLWWALDHAVTTYGHREAWENIMRQAMEQDYSWKKQIKHYLRLYEKVSGQIETFSVQIH
ncbi:MAG: glycogen synthase [Calditrichaeota bacterium]|nr:MAG: glycogen synthase [Calditrichota bacterium]